MKIKNTNLKFNGLVKRTRTNQIVLHHSAAGKSDAKTIHKWHLAKGWAGIGYHFVVKKNGTIERGRPSEMIGAHCSGHNLDTIGVCFEGDFTKKKMSAKQKKAGRELVAYLRKKYKLEIKDVVRHKDLLNTACPGKQFPYTYICGKPAVIKKGSKVRIKAGSKDLNTNKRYALFVYAKVYKVHTVSDSYVIFGNGTVVTGKTLKSNIKLVQE